MDWDEVLRGLVTALGLGLLIGVVRERAHVTTVAKAGTRTHALIALSGAVSWSLGIGPFIVVLLAVGALAVIGYLKTPATDPGMTGEVAIILTAVLGGLAIDRPVMASALGVVVAILLYVKKPLQHLTRELISDQELEDALMLAAAAVVVWPLLPDQPLDPWGVLDLQMVWKLVVLVMAVGLLGHIAQRAAGDRLGLPLAGFCSGFVSSTLAVASFGRQAKETPAFVAVAGAGALLANLSSLLLMSAILATAAPELFSEMMFALIASAGMLVVATLLCLFKDRYRVVLPQLTYPRAFKFTHAISIAAMIASVIMLSAWLREYLGEPGVLVTLGIVALAELHAAAASIAQLSSTGALEPRMAQWGVLTILVSASIAKALLAFVSGGKQFGLYVGGGLMAMLVVVSLVLMTQ